MKLFMFHFADRPYGGRFIAIIHNSEEEALEAAIKIAKPLNERSERDFREHHWLFVESTGAPVAVGTWVDGGYEE